MPAWSPGDLEASSYQRPAAGPPGLYRSKLGAVQPTGSRLIPEISLRFSVGPMQVIVENATDPSLDQLVKASGRRLKRAAGEPLLQLFAMPGPYSLLLTVPEAQAGLARDFGPVRIDPPDPAVSEGQPDTFLGGQYCIRHTFVLGGGTSSAVRSEYWWAGVVAGFGVQVFVLGTRTIINLEDARRLMDYVLVIPPS